MEQILATPQVPRLRSGLMTSSGTKSAAAEGQAITVSEVKRLVADLRSQGTDTRRVEAKAAKRDVPKSLYETLSSFANGQGGVCLLGVDESEDFRIAGVKDGAKVAADAGSKCSEMEPALFPTIDIVEVDGVHVVVVDVEPLDRRRRPCYRRASGIEHGTYIRRHDGDVRATWPEIQMMISEQSQPREDLRPVPGTSISDLDQELLDGLMNRVRRRRAFRGMDTPQALRQLNAVVEDGEDHLVLTVAGLFALGRYPQQHLGRAGIEYAIRPNEDQASSGIRLVRSQSFDGPVPRMVDEALGMLSTDLSGPVIIKGAKKQTRMQYPSDALREAIVNALVHRNLREDVGEATTIDVYPDRLVVRNPGGLYDLRETDLVDFERHPRSVARNGALLKLLEDVPSDSRETVVEARATGIRTMLREMRNAGMAPPRFRDEISTFTVEFPKHTLLDADTLTWLNSLTLDGLADQQRIALALALRGDHLDNTSYRQATGIGDSRVATRHLVQLVERGLLHMHGTRRWATYSLSERAAAPVTAPDGVVSGVVSGVVGGVAVLTKSEREAWVLNEIDQAGGVRVPRVVEGLGIGYRTAQRLMAEMVAAGLIVFEGAPRTGSYRRAHA